jgi:hypothetical protein
MATGMCVMFLPVAVPVPPLLWSAVFAVNTLWLASRVLTSPERALLVEPALCAAVMTAMFLVMPSSGVAGSIGPTGSAVSHAGHLAMVDPGLAAAGWVAAAGFLALAVRSGVRIATVGGPATAAGGPPVAAGSGAADGLPMRLVMAMGMAYMLLTML